MKKILFPIFSLLVIALCFTGCKTMHYYKYFQDIDTFDLTKTKGLIYHETKIMPRDELSIVVSTFNPEAARPFNMMTSSSYSGSDGGGGSMNQNGGNGGMQTYLVDNDGYINYPVIGRIHVSGLTKPECEQFIQEKIRPYFSATENPVVNVRIRNFHVTLLGEMGPSYLRVPNENMNIVDLLAAGGDPSNYAKRYKILLIRSDSTGEKHIHRYDLSKTSIFTDPYYYLQQGDIIYAEPTNQKTISASQGAWTAFWFSIVGWVGTAVALVISLTN